MTCNMSRKLLVDSDMCWLGLHNDDMRYYQTSNAAPTTRHCITYEIWCVPIFNFSRGSQRGLHHLPTILSQNVTNHKNLGGWSKSAWIAYMRCMLTYSGYRSIHISRADRGHRESWLRSQIINTAAPRTSFSARYKRIDVLMISLTDNFVIWKQNRDVRNTNLLQNVAVAAPQTQDLWRSKSRK